MTATTAQVQNALNENKPATSKPAFDYASLVGNVKDSDQTIERKAGAGAPKKDNPFAPVVAAARKDGKVKELPVPNQDVAEKVTGMLRRAAADNGHGLTSKIGRRGNQLIILFQTKDKKNVGEKKACPVCKSQVTVTADGVLRVHGPQDNRCKGSGSQVA